MKRQHVARSLPDWIRSTLPPLRMKSRYLLRASPSHVHKGACTASAILTHPPSSDMGWRDGWGRRAAYLYPCCIPCCIYDKIYATMYAVSNPTFPCIQDTLEQWPARASSPHHNYPTGLRLEVC